MKYKQKHKRFLIVGFAYVMQCVSGIADNGNIEMMQYMIIDDVHFLGSANVFTLLPDLSRSVHSLYS